MKDKKLVLKDILARLPYEVKCRYYDCCEGETLKVQFVALNEKNIWI